MAPREQRRLRRKWKVEKRQNAQAKKEAAEAADELMNTPPPTAFQLPEQVPTNQKLAGRRKIRRESRKAYRTIHAQQDKIKNLNKL